MNNVRTCLVKGLVASVLATSSLLITAMAASSDAARPGAGSAVGDEESFVATTAHCRTEDVHTWEYPAGYLSGQSVVCDILSSDPRIQGLITLQYVCPINGTTRCNATFRIAADSGARWEGPYWTERVNGTIGLLGVGLDGPAGAQIMLNIDNLQSGDGWCDDDTRDGVVGRITVMD